MTMSALLERHPRDNRTGDSDFLHERFEQRDNKTGYSDFLHEQRKEPPVGWAPRTQLGQPPNWDDVVVPLSDLIRTAIRRRSLLASGGGGLTATQVASQLGTNTRDVDQLRMSDRLLAVPDPNQNWLYPAFQFKGNQVVPGLDDVIAGFAVRSPWTRLYVLTSRDPALSGRTLMEALADGDVEAVQKLVCGYGQQGAA